MQTLKLTFIVLLLLSSAACAALQTKTEPVDFSGSAINRVVVLPVATDAQKADSFSAAEINNQQTGALILAELLTEYFSAHEQIRFITEDQVSTFKLNLSDNQNQQALALGRLLHGDAVMLWKISRYAEREGGEFSVKKPASVAFDYRLLLTDTGETLCAGAFEETQGSLTDNILSFDRAFKRGLKWVTARQLTSEGISSKLSTCRYLAAPKPPRPEKAGAQ